MSHQSIYEATWAEYIYFMTMCEDTFIESSIALHAHHFLVI